MTLCGWEGNCRSGVALAMNHRLSGPSTYGLNGLDREMSTPPTLRRGTARFFRLNWSGEVKDKDNVHCVKEYVNRDLSPIYSDNSTQLDVQLS